VLGVALPLAEVSALCEFQSRYSAALASYATARLATVSCEPSSVHRPMLLSLFSRPMKTPLVLLAFDVYILCVHYDYCSVDVDLMCESGTQHQSLQASPRRDLWVIVPL